MSIVQVLQNYFKNNWLKFGNDWFRRSGDFLRTDFENIVSRKTRLKLSV